MDYIFKSLFFLTYIFIELLFVIKQYQRYCKIKDPTYLAFGAFGLFYIVDSAFNVFYIVPWLLPFFVLVVYHSEVYYSDQLMKLKSSKYEG